MLFLLYSLCDLWSLPKTENLGYAFFHLLLNSTILLSFINSTPLTYFKSADDNHLFNVGLTVTVSSLAPCLIYLPFLNPHFMLTCK